MPEFFVHVSLSEVIVYSLIAVCLLLLTGAWLLDKSKGFFPAVADFFWVLQAFIRGKVLRQKAYIPNPDVMVFCANLVPPTDKTLNPFKMCRLAHLLRLWGPQKMTDSQINDLEGMMREIDPSFGYVPFKLWNPVMSRWDRYEGVLSTKWIDRKEMEAYMNGELDDALGTTKTESEVSDNEGDR